MQVNIPEADIQRADLKTISVGQVAIGPITVGELVLNGTNFVMSKVQGVLHNLIVTVTLDISFDWAIHIGLPFGPGYDAGDTVNLGSVSFSMPIDEVSLQELTSVNLSIPTLTAQNMSVTANPLAGLQVANAVAEQIRAQNITLPAAGFTIAGLNLNSVQGSAISVPAAQLGQATIGHVHGDPVTISSFTLDNLNLRAAQISAVSSQSPFKIRADLPGQSLPPFDGGVFKLTLRITPSVVSQVDRLTLSDIEATATVGQIVLHNVVLPYDVLNLTLSQVGITTIGIPAFAIS